MAVPTLSAPVAPDATQQRPLLRALIASIFMVFLDTRVVAALLPAIAVSLSISIPRAGLLVSSYMISYGIFQLFYAPLADRIGKVRVVIIAMTIFSAGTFACGFTSSFGLLVVLRAVTGAVGAAVFPMTLAYVGDTVPYDKRQATIAMLIAGASAATTLSAASGSLIAEVSSWQWVFPVFGVLGGLVTLLLFAMSRREHRVPPSQVPALKTYGIALKNRPLVRLIVLSFFEGALYFGCTSYLSGLFAVRYGMSTLGIGATLSIAGGAQLAAAYGLKPALKRLGENNLLTCGGLLMGLGVTTAALLPWWQLQPIAMLAAGAGFTFVHSTLQARASEALPKMRGTAISFFAFAVFAGSGIGTFVIGTLLPRTGYGPTLFGGGALLWVFTWAARRFSTPPKQE